MGGQLDPDIIRPLGRPLDQIWVGNLDFSFEFKSAFSRNVEIKSSSKSWNLFQQFLEMLKYNQWFPQFLRHKASGRIHQLAVSQISWILFQHFQEMLEYIPWFGRWFYFSISGKCWFKFKKKVQVAYPYLVQWPTYIWSSGLIMSGSSCPPI